MKMFYIVEETHSVLSVFRVPKDLQDHLDPPVQEEWL